MSDLTDFTVIDPASKMPVYRQLAAVLHHQIRTGQLPAGRPVPSKRWIRESTGLSSGSVDRAMAILKDEGLIEFVHGKGLYVTERWPGGADARGARTWWPNRAYVMLGQPSSRRRASPRRAGPPSRPSPSAATRAAPHMMTELAPMGRRIRKDTARFGLDPSSAHTLRIRRDRAISRAMADLRPRATCS